MNPNLDAEADVREALLKARELLVHKLLALKLLDVVLCAHGHKEADTTTVVDDAVGLQSLIAAHDGIGVTPTVAAISRTDIMRSSSRHSPERIRIVIWSYICRQIGFSSLNCIG